MTQPRTHSFTRESFEFLSISARTIAFFFEASPLSLVRTDILEERSSHAGRSSTRSLTFVGDCRLRLSPQAVQRVGDRLDWLADRFISCMTDDVAVSRRTAARVAAVGETDRPRIRAAGEGEAEREPGRERSWCSLRRISTSFWYMSRSSSMFFTWTSTRAERASFLLIVPSEAVGVGALVVRRHRCSSWRSSFSAAKENVRVEGERRCLSYRFALISRRVDWVWSYRLEHVREVLVSELLRCRVQHSGSYSVPVRREDSPCPGTRRKQSRFKFERKRMPAVMKTKHRSVGHIVVRLAIFASRACSSRWLCSISSYHGRVRRDRVREGQARTSRLLWLRLIHDRQPRRWTLSRLELCGQVDRCLSDRARDRRFSDVLRIVYWRDRVCSASLLEGDALSHD